MRRVAAASTRAYHRTRDGQKPPCYGAQIMKISITYCSQ